MNAAHQRRLTPVLGVTAVALGLIWMLLLGGVGSKVHWLAPRALAPLPPAGNANNLPAPIPLERFAVVWQHPLFSPDRKPTPRMASAGAGLGDLELTGIILTPTLRMALLRNKNGDHAEVRLREGASLPDGSVTLVKVQPRSATFDTSAGQTELKLPAGAPIDQPRTNQPGGEAAGTPASHDAPPSTGPLMNVLPGPVAPQAKPPPESPSQQKALERLRETIQKRRAGNAAAANAGVR
ncbi:MAG: hypothetical protein ACREPQ_15235 [Rhodanobacter sp.]